MKAYDRIWKDAHAQFRNSCWHTVTGVTDNTIPFGVVLSYNVPSSDAIDHVFFSAAYYGIPRRKAETLKEPVDIVPDNRTNFWQQRLQQNLVVGTYKTRDLLAAICAVEVGITTRQDIDAILHPGKRKNEALVAYTKIDSGFCRRAIMTDSNDVRVKRNLRRDGEGYIQLPHRGLVFSVNATGHEFKFGLARDAPAFIATIYNDLTSK